MVNTRHGNTATEIAADGNWMKVAKKHYIHGSGAEVVYDHNRYGWQIVKADGSKGYMFGALWVAKHYVEKAAKEA